MLTVVRELMNQLYLSEALRESSKQHEVTLIRLFSMLDMEYAGEVPSSYVSDIVSHDEENNVFNPYKLHSQAKTAFSNMFHGVLSNSLNISLMYGDIDPLTINRSEGIHPSPYYPPTEETIEEEKDAGYFSPAEAQRSRKVAVSAILPENIPLQLLTALSFLMQLNDDDFVGLVNHKPAHHILPSLLIGLTRRGHGLLVNYAMSRYHAIYTSMQTDTPCAALNIPVDLEGTLSGVADADAADNISATNTAATSETDTTTDSNSIGVHTVDADTTTATPTPAPEASAIPAAPWLLMDSYGHTPLIVAAQRGHCYLIHVLTSAPSPVAANPALVKDVGVCYKALMSHIQEFCAYYHAFSPSAVGIAADYIVALHRSVSENTPDSQLPAPIFRPRLCPQTSCPGRQERTVSEVDVCDSMGFTPLLHAIASQQALAAAFLIEVKHADHRWVSNGAVVATILTERVAEHVKVAVEHAIAKRMATKVVQAISHYTAEEFKIDYPF